MLVPLLAAFLVTPPGLARADSAFMDRPDWAVHFTRLGTPGTLVVLDLRDGKRSGHIHDRQRAALPLPPASTFKIPHTLLALDTGVVRDEFERIPWDGTIRNIPAHNQDQDLRSAMRHSALWVYEGFARRIGAGAARDRLLRMHYGNAEVETTGDNYWVDGPLRISALGQVGFLEKLYRNQLPFKPAHQYLVKDILVNAAGRDWILRAKTGWTGRLGWWVGWVEWPAGPVFFALNIDTPNGAGDLPKREALTREILRSIDALPRD